MRWIAGVTALLVGLAGCRCAEPSDEEKLKERIDTTSVHLYLATKIAILKGDESPDAKVARDALVRALDALHGQPAGTDAQGNPVRAMTAADALALAKALLVLKQQGQELLESGNEQGMRPILPLLFNPNPRLAEVLDLNHEHALLLSGLFIVKFHPRSPAPVPAEVLLYEAWMTRSRDLLPGFRSFVHMEKAVVYGTNELCNLASDEAKGADEEHASYDALLATLRVAGSDGAPPTHELDQALGAVRALAHGVSAQCHLGRDDKETGLTELDQTLDALEDSGVPAGELALVRAYAAIQRDDPKEARRLLQVAHDYPGTDPKMRADIAVLLDKVEEDPNVIEKKLGKGWFTYTLAKIVLRRLDELGAFDPIKQSELAKTIDGYVRAASEASSRAQEVVDPRGWVGKVEAWVSNEQPRIEHTLPESTAARPRAGAASQGQSE